MYKLSTFAAQDDRGYNVVPLFGPADSVFEKTASAALLPEVLKYIEKLKPRAGSQYVLVNAMGAGEYYGCFPAGTMVETEDGDVPIEEVRPGSMVRTHKNRYQPTVALTPKEATELCDLQIQGLPNNVVALSATPNHELWVVTREEFLAKQRKHIWYGDREEDLSDRRERAMNDLDFSWVPIGDLRKGDYIAEPFPLEEDPAALGDVKWNTPEVAFLMGLYAAEGCVAYRYDRDDEEPYKIVYVTGGHEASTHKMATKCAESLGHRMAHQHQEPTHSTKLELCDSALARLCLKHISSPAVDKKLSAALLRMPRGWQRVFFQAYADGDGCVRKSGKEEGTIRCVSASVSLLRGMRLLAARLGYAASISGRHNTKASWYNGNAIYELAVSGGQLRGRGTSKSYLHPSGYILSSVKTVEQYDWSGTVYDLTVTNDSSFVASGIAVHNSNINGDHFEEAGLIHKPNNWVGDPVHDRSVGKEWTYGFPTFYNAYPYAHHKNKDSSRAYGEVELAVWNDVMKRVELVCRVDHDKCEKFGGISVWDKLKTGQFPDVSMGSKVCYDLSSITTDWKLYREALDSYDPKKFAYPGLAVLDFHKKLKAKNNVGIRGLSITRKDYDEWTANHMNRILPDGRKVWVYNPYPRFFDISFVYIGADRTAKTMVFIVRHGDTKYVPSAEAGEKTAAMYGFDGRDKQEWVLRPQSPLEKKLEEGRFQSKVASVQDALLEEAFKGAAKLKEGEIDKEISPSQFGSKGVPLLEQDDKDLPDWATDALGSVPVDQALGTTAAMGIVLKPKEFQKILLIRLGKRGLAEELDASGKVFPPSTETTPMDLGPGSFSAALAHLLLPLLLVRSALGPFSEMRVISAGQNNQKPTSHSTEELRKMGSSYNGYRQALMDMVALTQEVLPLAAPADDVVAKLASAPPEELFTPLAFSYLTEAHMPIAGGEDSLVHRQHRTAGVREVSPPRDTFM